MYGRPRNPGDPVFPNRFPQPPRNIRPTFGGPPRFPDQRTQYFPSAFPPGLIRPVADPSDAANFRPPQYFQAQRRPEFRGARHPGARGSRPRGNRGRGGSYNRGEGNVEVYYNHSMVEDPWKGLEKKYQETTG